MTANLAFSANMIGLSGNAIDTPCGQTDGTATLFDVQQPLLATHPKCSSQKEASEINAANCFHGILAGPAIVVREGVGRIDQVLTITSAESAYLRGFSTSVATPGL
jgi:hypothetical protein